jgi:hypothetical protein
MNADLIGPQKWSPTFRWLLIALVFLAHIGFIFALGDRKPHKSRLLPPGIALGLAPAENELLALNNASLLALPHRQSFSGEAWLKPAVVEFEPYRWEEPSRELDLTASDLGSVFLQFMQTNRFVSFPFPTKLTPQPPSPSAIKAEFILPTNSSLTLSAEFKDRRLLNPPNLQPMAATDLLTNTVVQVLVTTEGDVMSYTLLSRSGSAEADKLAIEFSKQARFEKQRIGAPVLKKGNLIFEWFTVPKSADPKTAR